MPPLERKRVNINIGLELYNWFENKSHEIGVPVANLIVIALNDYRKLQITTDSLPMFEELLNSIRSTQPISATNLPLPFERNV